MGTKEVGDITEHVLGKLFQRHRISQPEKVYSAIQKLTDIEYLENIRFEIGTLKLNKAGLGLILAADYVGDKKFDIDFHKPESVSGPEIAENINKIFEDLNKKTGLRFSAYYAELGENQCRAYLNLRDDERLDFILMGK